jgi:hypothetical protein
MIRALAWTMSRRTEWSLVLVSAALLALALGATYSAYHVTRRALAAQYRVTLNGSPWGRCYLRYSPRATFAKCYPRPTATPEGQVYGP